MTAPKIAIVFYTSHGTNYEVAKIAAAAAREAGAEVRVLRTAETASAEVIATVPSWAATVEALADVPVATEADMIWADGYFFAVPTRFGNVASQMQAFIDTLGGAWSQGKLSGKAATVTTSTSTAHGGNEATILGFYTTLMHWGAVLVPPGFTHPDLFKTGNPYGYSHRQGQPFGETETNVIGHQAKRLVEVAGKLLA